MFIHLAFGRTILEGLFRQNLLGQKFSRVAPKMEIRPPGFLFLVGRRNRMFPPAARRIHALIHDSILNVDTGEGYYLRAGGRGLGPDVEEVQAGSHGRGTRNKALAGG